MHCLTQRGQWEIRIDYLKNDKTWSYLHYNQFSVGSAREEYPLTIGGFTRVGDDDWFARNNGMKFTTLDNHNDNRHCATHYKSGWWYNKCAAIVVNSQPPWVAEQVLHAEMKIRPKGCIIQ